MGFPGKPRSRTVEGISTNREHFASYLEMNFSKHYRLFNLTEEEYDPLLFDCSVRKTRILSTWFIIRSKTTTLRVILPLLWDYFSKSAWILKIG